MTEDDRPFTRVSFLLLLVPTQLASMATKTYCISPSCHERLADDESDYHLLHLS